jgi:hypothetical protein
MVQMFSGNVRISHVRVENALVLMCRLQVASELVQVIMTSMSQM